MEAAFVHACFSFAQASQSGGECTTSTTTATAKNDETGMEEHTCGNTTVKTVEENTEDDSAV